MERKWLEFPCLLPAATHVSLVVLFRNLRRSTICLYATIRPWKLTIAVGDMYPNSNFTGIDLSPIQPSYVPENVEFFVDDFEEEWLDPKNKYDLIHIRQALHSVRDPKLLAERAFRLVSPLPYPHHCLIFSQLD